MKVFVLLLLSFVIVGRIQSSYIVVDAGSSGTRAYVFAHQSDCVGGGSGKNKIEFTPQFARMSESQAEQLGTALVGLKIPLQGTAIFGGATAGLRNRPIANVNALQDKSTILGEHTIYLLPGFLEALYEFIAVNGDGQSGSLNEALKSRIDGGSLRNFISAGGASAQMGIVLKPAEFIPVSGHSPFHQHLLQPLGSLLGVKRLDFTCRAELSGYKQQFAPDYFALLRIRNSDGRTRLANVLTLDTRDTDPSEDVKRLWKKRNENSDKIISNEDLQAFCSSEYTCVLLLSFLAGDSPDATKKCHQAYSETGAVQRQRYHNVVGGAKETFYNFVRYHLKADGSPMPLTNVDAFRPSNPQTQTDDFWDLKESAGGFGAEFPGGGGGFACKAFTDDLDTVKKELATFMYSDSSFHVVSSYLEGMRGRYSIGRDAWSNSFYSGGSFSNFLDPTKNANKDLVTDASKVFAWGGIFMEVYAELMSIYLPQITRPVNEGDWPYGMIFAKTDDVDNVKCDKIIPSGSSILGVNKISLLLVLESEIDGVV